MGVLQSSKDSTNKSKKKERTEQTNETSKDTLPAHATVERACRCVEVVFVFRVRGSGKCGWRARPCLCVAVLWLVSLIRVYDRGGSPVLHLIPTIKTHSPNAHTSIATHAKPVRRFIARA